MGYTLIQIIIFCFQLKHSRTSEQFTSMHKSQTQDNVDSETLNAVSYENAFSYDQLVLNLYDNFLIIVPIKTYTLYSTAFISRNLCGS